MNSIQILKTNRGGSKIIFNDNTNQKIFHTTKLDGTVLK